MTQPIEGESDKGAATIALAISGLVVLYLVQGVFVLALAFGLEFRASYPFAWTAMLRYSGLAAKLAALAFVLSRGVRAPWILGPRLSGGTEAVRATLSCCLFASALYVVLGFSRVENSGAVDSSSVVDQMVAFGLSVSLIPLLEELIFRGVLLRSLLERMPKVLAVTLSAIVFGGFHSSIVTAISGFVLGSVLGVLLVRTKSLLVCVLAHSAWNLTVRSVNLFDAAQSVIVGLRSEGLDGAFAVSAMAAGLLLLLWPGFPRTKIPIGER